MHKLICVLVAVSILNNCSSQKKVSMNAPNKLTPTEKSTGWKLLFDGKSAAGWHGYGRTDIATDWKVEDGVIMLAPDKSVKNRQSNDIITDDEYGNFHLKLDWKIAPKGNSGIIFYVQEDTSKFKESHNTGPEMQVLDNGTLTRPGHTDAKLYTHRAGDLYDLIASKEAVRPQGEWNHVEIISNKGKLDFYMNGVHTLSTTLWNDHWNEMLAISKFKNLPDFGKFKQGKIALQDHGEEVAFRNIKIKKL